MAGAAGARCVSNKPQGGQRGCYGGGIAGNVGGIAGNVGGLEVLLVGKANVSRTREARSESARDAGSR